MPLFFFLEMKITVFSFLVGFDLGNGIFKAKQKIVENQKVHLELETVFG